MNSRRDPWRGLIMASIVGCAAAVVLYIVHCGLLLLGTYHRFPVGPRLSMIPCALAMAIAIVLTGLAFLAGIQKRCDQRSSRLRRMQVKTLAAVASLIPLVLTAGLVAGINALTRWLDSW